jgi:hypothetical protein
MRSPQVLPELFGAPTGEKTQGRGQGGCAANVYWAPQASTELFGTTGGGITTKTYRTAHAGKRGAEPPSVVGYGDGVPRGDDEATAFAARLARVMMAARRTGDVEAAAVALKTTPRRMTVLPHDDESDDEAHQGARRRPPRATKVARRTEVDEAAFTSTMDDAEDNDVAPPTTRTPTTAPTTMPTTTSRGAQSRGRPGTLTSTAQGAYARRPPPTTAMTTPMTPPTRSRSQGRPTRPTRRGIARGADAWRSPARARLQRDRDGATAT